MANRAAQVVIIYHWADPECRRLTRVSTSKGKADWLIDFLTVNSHIFKLLEICARSLAKMFAALHPDFPILPIVIVECMLRPSRNNQPKP